MLFQKAIESYKKQAFDDARKFFTELLSQNKSSEVYYDLGLVEYDSKNLGPAVANWRKAIALDPHNQLAQDSLNFIQKRIEHPELNRQIDNFEMLRNRILIHSQIEYLALLSILIFGCASWLFLSYLGERKRSREQELSPPPVPWVFGVLLVLFFLSFFLSGAKVYDLTLARATVLPSKIQVLSAPDPESTTLFELFEGLEVIVDSSHDDFLQITFPGGMSGWTLKKNLMLNGGSET